LYTYVCVTITIYSALLARLRSADHRLYKYTFVHFLLISAVCDLR